MNLLILLAVAAAPAELSYGSGTLELQKLAATPDATLAQQVAACMKGYGVTQLNRRGEATPLWTPVTAAGSTLAAVNRSERVALLSVLGRKMVGYEVDILVPQPDGKSQPVSVTWQPDGAVTFESGPAVGALVDETMTIAKLKEQFEVGEFLETDARWDGATLGLVHQALATLTKEERALVKGLVFRRVRLDGIHRAKYERGDDSNWINVYDAAFLFAREQFTGSVRAPRPEALVVMLHELGHALADARFREKGVVSKAAADEYKRRLPEVDAAAAAYTDKEKQLGPKPDAAGAAQLKTLDDARTKTKADSDARFKEGDRLVKQMFANDQKNTQGRPVEKAFAAVLEPKKSPTRYGKGSAKEHFAECFTLFKNDPEALRRVSAPAADWFAAGTHVQLAGKALDP